MNDVARVIEEVIKHLPTLHNQKMHAGKKGAIYQRWASNAPARWKQVENLADSDLKKLYKLRGVGGLDDAYFVDARLDEIAEDAARTILEGFENTGNVPKGFSDKRDFIKSFEILLKKKTGTSDKEFLTNVAKGAAWHWDRLRPISEYDSDNVLGEDES